MLKFYTKELHKILHQLYMGRMAIMLEMHIHTQEVSSIQNMIENQAKVYY